ncbi:MAG: ferrous iron transport protein B [Deltaproteobacteria bacterium]|nr:MAG: ferrous iron transport protein B [Deltaproteobacteria bacterium]HDH86671.1 ferrous iron transport protein B [Desulfobacteraceae bacterium]
MTKKIKIALAGNPNSGKTTVFNNITGARQNVGNWPGVTVEKKSGLVKYKDIEIEVVDLPGIYSLTAYSIEEIVARNFLINEKPDVVIDIVDAANLERNLYLAVQFLELGVPLIIALNMVDVSEARGITIDVKKLSEMLEIPVVATVARSNKGTSELLDQTIKLATDKKGWKPANLCYGGDIITGINDIEKLLAQQDIYSNKYPTRWLAIKSLEGDQPILDMIKKDETIGPECSKICEKINKHIKTTLDQDAESLISDYRYGYIVGITKKVVKRKRESMLYLSDKVDRILTNRILGPIIMLLVLYGIYEFTFRGSELPVILFERFFELLSTIVSSILPESIFRSLIVSGLIDGVGSVLSFVPLLMFMFFAIAILEDSGYIARIAYMMDRVLRLFGLHGSSVMALIISGGISGGCAVPGVMATRTLKGSKERLATMLVLPFMNCGAKLPVFAMLIAAFFAKNEAMLMFLLTLLSWCFALIAAKLLRITILKGPKTPFVMELPPYRLPTFKGLLIHTWERTWMYIKKAGTVILAISILLWIMMTFPRLTQDKIDSFNEKKETLIQKFLSIPEVNKIIGNSQGIASFDKYYDLYIQGSEKEREIARKYDEIKEGINKISFDEQRAALEGSFAGIIGKALTTLTNPLGFEYRTNIALIGGFAAKEVILSTLGTAYSLGECVAEEPEPLSVKLQKEPGWNQLTAFTLIIFMMLYVPCFVTVITIKKESNWRWALFSMIYSLVSAYVVALIVHQAGLFLGVGV